MSLERTSVRGAALGRLLLLPLLLAGLTACGTTDPEEPVPFGAKVEGLPWVASEYSAVRSGDHIVINGWSSLDIEITLELVSDTVGTYRLGIGLSSATLVDEGATYVADGTTAGSVTVTEVTDDRIVGYFGFTGKFTGGGGVLRDVTNGEFSLELSSE